MIIHGLIIALGGTLGVLLRWGAQEIWGALTGLETAWATLLINFIGSAAMAAVMGLGSGISEPLRLALTTGLLGGFTTFSAYSWDALQFFARGDWARGIIYFFGTPLAGLLGAALIMLLRLR